MNERHQRNRQQSYTATLAFLSTFCNIAGQFPFSISAPEEIYLTMKIIWSSCK